jgi:hypothetical protein
MVMAMMTVDDESAEVIIPRALKVVDEDLDEAQQWPGTDFEARDEEHELAFQAIVSEYSFLVVEHFEADYDG